MRARAVLLVLWLSGACFALGAAAHAATEALKPGTRVDSLPAGATIYHDVQIRSIDARSVVITHRGGLAAIRLRDLSPEWQARFNYSAGADVLPEPPAPKAPRRTPRAQSPGSLTPPKTSSSLEQVRSQWGQPANMRSEVDLRAKFAQLELHVKNQGRRPSCAVFAIVSALEYQNAELTGEVEKFSEQYLIWATRRLSSAKPLPVPAVPTPAVDDADHEETSDEGFALAHVVAGIRAYGIALQSSMPNTFGRSLAAIADPSSEIIEAARTKRRVSVYAVLGETPAAQINNIVHALNAGVPVPIGVCWPHFRTLRGGYLNAQKPLPDDRHAVTLVGYKCPTGEITETVFTFKNSYGPTWGQGGYGQATYAYLHSYLRDAIVLDVQFGTASGAGASPGR